MKIEDSHYLEIDDVTKEWSQGDYLKRESNFIFCANPSHHIASNDKLDPEDAIIEDVVVGLCIVSQTCDIVRKCKDRPYLEVAPLVEVDIKHIIDIKRGKRPQYAYLPPLEKENLVVDLDRIMTVEKSFIKGATRCVGLLTDAERRSFARSLTRKRARFAFPDDFNDLLSQLSEKFKKAHDKSNAEGRALQALREVRVRATPSWDAGNIEVELIFIRDENQNEFEGKNWEYWLDFWSKLVVPKDRYTDINFEVETLNTLSAKHYLESDALDLDHLTKS